MLYICKNKAIAMERNKKEEKKTAKKAPKESSKAEMFLKKHPNGIGEIIDMKAVLK